MVPLYVFEDAYPEGVGPILLYAVKKKKTVESLIRFITDYDMKGWPVELNDDGECPIETYPDWWMQDEDKTEKRSTEEIDKICKEAGENFERDKLFCRHVYVVDVSAGVVKMKIGKSFVRLTKELVEAK